MVTIPFEPSISPYRFGVTLDQTQYIFDVHWNERDSAWLFDVRTSGDVLVYAGVKIVLGAILGRRCRDTRFPPGFIVAVDTSGNGVEATYDDLGTRLQVIYYTAEEVAAL